MRGHSLRLPVYGTLGVGHTPFLGLLALYALLCLNLAGVYTPCANYTERLLAALTRFLGDDDSAQAARETTLEQARVGNATPAAGDCRGPPSKRWTVKLETPPLGSIATTEATFELS